MVKILMHIPEEKKVIFTKNVKKNIILIRKNMII